MPIDFNNIKTSDDRPYNAKWISRLNDSLQYLPATQRASVIGSVIEESGGDPLSTSSSGKYQGLLHWGPNRYRIKSEDFEKELSNQLRYLRESLNDTTDHKSWTDGGDNSGYDSFRDTYSRFHNESLPLDTIFRAFSFGYVRPAGKQGTYIRRNKVVHQVFDILNSAEGQQPQQQLQQKQQQQSQEQQKPKLSEPVNNQYTAQPDAVRSYRQQVVQPASAATVDLSKYLKAYSNGGTLSDYLSYLREHRIRIQ